MKQSTPQDYRDSVLDCFRALSTEELQKQSANLVTHTVAFIDRGAQALQGLRVGAYRNFPKTEPHLDSLWETLRERGAILFFPVKVSDSKPLDFEQEITGHSLAAGALDWIFVPGLAFSSLNGGRIGRGKGYYDRTLLSARQESGQRVNSVALALDFQVFESALPTHSGDQSVDAILTPTREFVFQSRS